jgi:hypothetical protein
MRGTLVRTSFVFILGGGWGGDLCVCEGWGAGGGAFVCL